jgi:hypothetical protein
MYAPIVVDGKGKEEENDPKQRNGSFHGPAPGQGIDSLQSFLHELAQGDVVTHPGTTPGARGGVVFDLPARPQAPVVEVGQDALTRLEQELGRLIKLAKPESRQEQEFLRHSLAEQVEDFLNEAVDVLRGRFSAKKQLNAADLARLDLEQVLQKHQESNEKLLEQSELLGSRNAELRGKIGVEEERSRRLAIELQEAQRQGQALETDLQAWNQNNDEKQLRVVAAQAKAKSSRDQVEKRSEMLEAIQALEEERDVLRKQVENLKLQARNSKMTAVSHANLDGSKHKEEVEQLRSQLEHSNRQLQQVQLAEVEMVRLRKERGQTANALELARSEKAAYLEERQATNVKMQRLMAALKKLTGL